MVLPAGPPPAPLPPPVPCAPRTRCACGGGAKGLACTRCPGPASRHERLLSSPVFTGASHRRVSQGRFTRVRSVSRLPPACSRPCPLPCTLAPPRSCRSSPPPAPCSPVGARAACAPTPAGSATACMRPHPAPHSILPRTPASPALQAPPPREGAVCAPVVCAVSGVAPVGAPAPKQGAGAADPTVWPPLPNRARTGDCPPRPRTQAPPRRRACPRAEGGGGAGLRAVQVAVPTKGLGSTNALHWPVRRRRAAG